jgi:hypothetical protein
MLHFAADPHSIAAAAFLFMTSADVCTQRIAMAIIGYQISPELCRVLGLPRNTISFTLRASVDEVVTVQCEYYPDGLGRDVVRALAEYTLIRQVAPVEPTAESDLFDFDVWLAARNQAAHIDMMARSFRLNHA